MTFEKLKTVLLTLLLCLGYGAYGQIPSWVALRTNAVKPDTARAFCLYVSDINNDKYPDIVTVEGAWGVGAKNGIRIYLNVDDTAATADPKERMFVDVTTNSGVNNNPVSTEPSRGTLVVALADVNNDGKVDLVRGNYYHTAPTAYDDRCEVLLGDGQGHFNLVANNGLHELGQVNPMGYSFLDYNKDGKVDLFIGLWFENYAANTMRSGILMKGNGDGTFTNVSSAAGITTPEPMYGCGVVDWNNDGWPDIATDPYCRTGGQLWKNNGNGTFSNVASSANYDAQHMQGDNGQDLCMWSSVPEDFDNDGDMDFFFSLVHGGLDANEGHSTIVMNGGAANSYHLDWDMSRVTRDVPRSTHTGDYDASWFDIDNDGLMDITMAQGHYMPSTDRLYVFRQGTNGNFSDITQELDLINSTTSDLHLVEVMDYDLDGDDDILFCRNGQPRTMSVVRNKIGQSKHWVGVRLVAPPNVNKSSIGARIIVWSGGVKRTREVYAGRGNGAGQQPFALLFGLNNNASIDSVKVQWPSADNLTTTVKNPPINQYITIGAGGLLSTSNVIAGNNTAELKLYPNPAKDFILVQLTDAKAEQIQVYDMTGRLMIAMTSGGKWTSGTQYCSTKHLAPGNYTIKVTSKEGKTFSQLFIKSE